MSTQLYEKDINGNKIRGIEVGPREPNFSVMIPGFERTGTTEPRFKLLADQLEANGFGSLRLDMIGLGLSDGEFDEMTVDKTSDEMIEVCKNLGLEPNQLVLIGHSLGACVIADMIQKGFIPGKIILFAPALNQRALMRYWFVKGKYKKDLTVDISWENYLDYLNEAEFLEFIAIPEREVKAHILGGGYFAEVAARDFSDLITPYVNRVFHIHGDLDDDVPLDSLRIVFPHQILVNGGDHDVQHPRMVEQWMGPLLKFLLEDDN